MGNLILYSERYEAITKIDISKVKLHRLVDDNKIDLDSFINNEIADLNLEKETFKNIFIPLSPIGSFTDYTGLRIALYIKLCNTKSKLANIHIYGLDDLADLINHDCFQVLKLKEVNFIDFSKSAVNNILDKEILITESNWKSQIQNLSIKIPDDYVDNHGIANEWGIYQMARNANLDVKNVEGFSMEKFNKLYFKWLIAKNELYEEIPEEQKEIQKRYGPKLKGLTLKGNIDLSKFPQKK